MLKISAKLSVRLSLTVAILFLAALVGACFFAPYLSDLILQLPEGLIAEPPVTAYTFWFLLAVIYVLIATAAVAALFMIRLLIRVNKGLVFTDASVSLLRGVSWCCMLGSLLFVLLGIYVQLALPIAFVALFVGMCLRVVKNVIEEAVAIKSENDLTV